MRYACPRASVAKLSITILNFNAIFIKIGDNVTAGLLLIFAVTMPYTRRPLTEYLPLSNEPSRCH